MNRLAILEDNLEFSRKLLNYIISRNKKIRLSSLAVKGEEIMDVIDELDEDDILLLDLGLPEIDGLDVIDRLKDKKERIPKIIVMSGDMNLLERLKNYISYIYTAIAKPFSFQRIGDVIDQITYESEQKCYEKLIKEELYKFEMNVTTVGYAYIVDAIAFSLENEAMLKDMQNVLYKNISIKYNNISTTNIKWTIEKCVKSTKRYTSSSIIKEYFHVEAREKLTPKLFISTVVENLKKKLDTQSGIKRKETCYF